MTFPFSLRLGDGKRRIYSQEKKFSSQLNRGHSRGLLSEWWLMLKNPELLGANFNFHKVSGGVRLGNLIGGNR